MRVFPLHRSFSVACGTPLSFASRYFVIPFFSMISFNRICVSPYGYHYIGTPKYCQAFKEKSFFLPFVILLIGQKVFDRIADIVEHGHIVFSDGKEGKA